MLLFVERCLLFVVCRLSCAVRRVPFVVCRLSSVAWCLATGVCYLFVVMCLWLCVGCCVFIYCLPHVECLVLFGVCCVSFVVDRRSSFVVRCCLNVVLVLVACSLSFVVCRLSLDVFVCCLKCVVWFAPCVV